MPIKYRADIDGLRAVSVLLVFLFHANVKLCASGFIGVDVFFVISGFLITSGIKEELDRGNFSVRAFYTKRLWRLSPVLIALMFVTLLITTVTFFPEDYKLYTKSLKKLSFFISNSYFASLNTDYLAPATGIMPLLHTWSLSIEWQWYIALPLLMLALYKLKPRAHTAVVICLTVLAALVTLYLSKDSIEFYYSFRGRLFEMLIGSSVAYMGAAKKGNHLLSLLSLAALGFIIYIGFKPGVYYSYPNVYAIIVSVAAGFLIYAGAAINPVSSLLSIKPLAKLGVFSYSFYIWHWPAVAVCTYWGIASSWGRTAGLFAFSLVASAASYYLVENRFRTYYKRYNFTKTLLILFAFPVLVSFGLYELVINSNDPVRLGKKFVRIQEVTDYYKSYKGWSNLCDNSDIFTLADSCRTGEKEGVRKALLTGDSYADNYWMFMDVLGKDAGLDITVFATGGCPPLEDPNHAKCAPRTESLLKKLSEGEHGYEYVILGSVWARSFNNLGEYEFRRRLENMLTAITAAGARPVLFYNNYDAGDESVYDPTDRNRFICTSQHIVFPRLVGSCDFADNTASSSAHNGYIALVEELKEKYGIITVDLKVIQCPRGICRTQIDNYPIYRDRGGHLTDYASYLFAKEFLDNNTNPFK